jgi:hypothetical protein
VARIEPYARRVSAQGHKREHDVPGRIIFPHKATRIGSIRSYVRRLSAQGHELMCTGSAGHISEAAYPQAVKGFVPSSTDFMTLLPRIAIFITMLG